MGKKITLGVGKIEKEYGVAVVAKPEVEEELKILMQHIRELNEAFGALCKKDDNKNKDGLPIDMYLIGNSPKGTYYLIVDKDGYRLGNTKHNSLCSAAQFLCGTDINGFSFWRTTDNKTIEEFLRGK